MSHLLHLLFSLLLGPMFMFAAGDGGIGGLGGSAGSGDGSGAGAGEGAGDGAADDGGGGEGADGASAAAGADGQDGSQAAGEGAGAGVDDPDAPVDLGDGRTVPAKWKNLFEAAKAQGLDKEVKQLFFGQQRLAEKFPGGINEAVKLADTIKEFGGVDGIGEIKADNEAFQQDAETYMNEPAKWLGETFQNNPEAALKAFALSLDYVAENHEENYNHLMAKVIINDLNSSAPVRQIYDLLAGLKDNPQAQELAKKLASYYNYRDELSKKVPEKKVDAERQKLETERQQLGTEKEKLLNHTVNSQTIPRLGKNMTTQIEKVAKDAGFDLKNFIATQPGAAQAMRTQILNLVMEKAAGDKTFLRNYKSVLKEGNTQRAASMMDKKHDEVLNDIVRDVAGKFGIKKKAGTKPNTGGGGTQRAAASAGSGTILRVSGKPAANEIDWTKTGNRIYDSEAVLKNGKVVTWA